MTNENPIRETQPVQGSTGTGCLGQLGWFFSGAVLPMGSFSYYRKAARKSVGSAILFFVVFTLTLSILTTLKLAVDMFSVIGSIQESYAAGEVPVITITHGIANVDGPQPYIFVDQRTSSDSVLVAVDTTGKLREIDRDRYQQGFLLTRTELHMLTPQNGYQVLPLAELHSAFNQDPLVINAETVSQAWGVMSVIIVVFAFLFIAIWFTVVRLMIIAMIALLLWGIATLIKPGTGFGPIIITGLYAIVPAIYLSHLFSRSDLSFPGLQTFFLLVFWTIGLGASLMDVKFFSEERPLRAWTALLGAPLLIIYVVDIFWPFPSPYGIFALWAVTLLTVLALVALRLFFRYRDAKPEGQPLA